MTEKELRSIFSENIKERRSSCNWSQVQLAQKSGISVNFINDLEAGRKWASPATLVKLAKAFKMEAYEFLKPPGLLPDNLNGILQKYADSIHHALEQTRHEFVQTEQK